MMEAEERARLMKEISPKPYLVPDKDYDFDKRYITFMRIARTICPQFEITHENKEIFEESIKYFAADESCKYDLNKSLLIYGPIGVGKTLYFKIFSALTRAVESRNTFRIFKVNDLLDGVAKDGYKYFTSSGITPDNCIHRSDHIFIDDIGQSAKTANHFGNNINVVNEVIRRRYYAYTDNFVLTHVSTNIVPEDIIQEYGDVINSRMREMYNPILFPGKDRRK